MKFILKVLKYICLAILAIVLIVGAINVVELHSFYSTATKEFVMPGIDDYRFDEQGIDYDEDSGYFFFVGYMSDASANPIYLVDSKTNETIKTVYLLNSDGSNFNGHAGGIAVTDKFVYIAGSIDCCLYVYDKDDILKANDGESITCYGVFPTALNDEDGVKASCLTKTDDMVYVGEFHFPITSYYKLRDNHKLNTKNGNNSALMIGFEIDQEAPLGLKETPSIAYSIPDKVQGICFDSDKIILSKSLGPLPSIISYNEASKEGEFNIMNVEVPLYSLKEISSIYVPPMSEEIDLYDGKLYIASELYNTVFKGFGKLWNAQYCWSINSY